MVKFEYYIKNRPLPNSFRCDSLAELLECVAIMMKYPDFRQGRISHTSSNNPFLFCVSDSQSITDYIPVGYDRSLNYRR